MSTMDWGELIAEASAELDAAGVAAPEADAELICAHVLGDSRGRVRVLSMLGSSVDEDLVSRVRTLVSERARRVPLQHLTGRAPFRGIELAVGPGVFVPRPETETVAQFAIDELRAVAAGGQSTGERSDEVIALDLCTGSGAISLAIADEVPYARVWAIEKSADAHAWADRNVRALGDGRVVLLQGDVRELGDARELADVRDPGEVEELADIRDSGERSRSAASPVARVGFKLAGRVDVLVSNPPYVPEEMVPRDPEVRDHDPELALYSGADGLDLIRVISRVGLALVRPGGLLVLEHAETQGSAIRNLLAAAGWSDAATHPDLTGRDRATTARR
ncbi:peptide chain release factor N(5)-glutamine methyltransferase [Leucobacter sp. GX24907]